MNGALLEVERVKERRPLAEMSPKPFKTASKDTEGHNHGYPTVDPLRFGRPAC